ncbi:MAG TPA: carboxypeptidase regulatory-like domain-containing protein, partial [Terriglobales bacterium]|nr:carboxypeptidase regulatory-like domain-containing protein [Terriglobales bacterium]
MYITSSTRKDKAGHAWLSAASVLLVITLLTMLVPRASAQSDFTIIALPDTQYYSETYPNTFTAQTKWVVDNAAALNIQTVLGLGDIVNTASNTWEWQNADTSIKLLDSANIPYLLAIGNHDYSDSGDSSGRTSETTNFNAFFGPSRYQGYSWYKGQYPAGSNENFYGILTINGKQYLFLMLEFYPRDAALAWATSVIAANPAAEVIVVTHSYVYIDNTRVSLCDSINAQTYNVGADNDGEALWKKFVSQYSQISLVLNGHFAYTDSTAEGVGRRTDLGVNGNIVNEMLSDYQEMTNGGNGYLRILKFRPSLNTIEVSTYSPTLNAYLSDSNNQFTVQWHSTGTPPSGTGTVGGQVQNLSCEAISGATVSTGSGSATTDSQGNFSLNATAPAAYTVTAQASGYAPSSDAINVWTGYPDSVKYFLSTQQPGSISGKVTNTSGAAISSATVWYSGGTTKTDSSGDYTFSNVPPETYTVTASQSGYQTSSNQNVSVSSGITTSSNLVLTATSTGSIAGTVTNATGTGIANATVSYSGGSATATTNSSGGYTLNVVPGSYSVTATAVGYLSATQPGVSVAAGATTALNFALTQSGTISGTVTNGAGTGIANAT